MALRPLAKEQLRPLLKLNDQLRELASLEQDINVTSIVAVGDQSHGKSSVIEALSGIDLPRGEDIQTRLPLVLQLRNCQDPSEERAILSADGIEERNVSLKGIAEAVRNLTQEIAGERKDVVDRQVELKVFKVDQDDLTLIDLPGMTRVAVDGQHAEIEETITKMYQRYMKPSETVILNVVSAMADFSTSASLKLSQQLDSVGTRTLLCVTKVDQYRDPGLAAKISKAAEQLHLQHDNIFCVRNRSQPENDAAVDLVEARKREDDFFCKHDELQTLPKDSVGIGALSRRLVMQQYSRIRATLPEASCKIDQRISELEDAMTRLGPVIGSESEGRAMFQQRLARLFQTLRDENTGRINQASATEVVGRSLELCLDVDDLSKLRTTKKVGEYVVGPSVNINDVPLCLRLYPNETLNGDTRKANHADSGHNAVGLYVSAKLPTIVTSVGILTCFEALSEEGSSIKYHEGQKADIFTADTNCWGQEKFLDSNTAGKCGRVSFKAHLYIQSIKRKDGNDGRPILCAAVHKQNKSFAEAVNKLYSNSYFFSSSFKMNLEAKFQARSGALGLPGTLVPEPALIVLKDMRAKLAGAVNCHVEALELIADRAWKCRLSEFFDEFPQMHKIAVQSIDDVLKTQKKQSHEMTRQILAWEDSIVFTENHYFMDTVQSLRKLILGADSITEKMPEQFAFLSSKTLENLRNLSNEEQRIVDVQIEIYAYWKTMKKRLIDYVSMCSQHELIQQPLNELMAQRIHNAIEDKSKVCGGLAKLMAPPLSKLLEVRATMARLDALKKAQDLIRSQPDMETLNLAVLLESQPETQK